MAKVRYVYFRGPDLKASPLYKYEKEKGIWHSLGPGEDLRKEKMDTKILHATYNLEDYDVNIFDGDEGWR